MPLKFIGATALLLFACVVAASADRGQAQHDHGAAATTTVKVIPLKPAPPGPLPPLPTVSFAPVRPMPVTLQVYEFAARHPEVLQYVPCYCGCERAGHNGNHDCFVKTRAANGRITEWDAHGLGCAICLDVGRRAMTLFNEKKSVKEIRAVIDQEFGTRFPSQTPTPRPPNAKS
jgi:hypothetical protein